MDPASFAALAAEPSLELASARPARVLVARLDNIGDVVMLGPALRALRDGLPAAAIDLLASPAGAAAAPLLPWLDDVWTARVAWQDMGGRTTSGAAELAFVERLRARAYDAVLIFTSFSQTAWPMAYAALLAGIPVRVGMATDFGGGVLTHVVSPPPTHAHQVDRDLHLVAACGLPLRGRDLEVVVPAAATAAAQRLLGEAGLGGRGRYVVLAPGASCATRRYDPGRLAAAASVAAESVGARVVLVGGPAERDLEPAVGAAAPGCVSLVDRTSVPELAAVIAGAALVMTSHSLPMHLADALGRPVVVAFSGTDLAAQWAPRRSPLRLLQRPTACRPCHRLECPIGLPCLDIPADEAARAGIELLTTVAQEEPWLASAS